MNSINLQEIIYSKLFIISLAIFIPISVSIAYVYSNIDSDDEEFLRLTIFGKNMSISDYYPSESPFIRVDEKVNWYVQVYNNMKESELIQLKFKVANATEDIAIYEDVHLIASNSTYLLPIEWTIKDAKVEVRGNNTYSMIEKIIINDNEINTNIINVNGTDFRAIIELWRYDINTNRFEFDNNRVTWNQIWFKIR